MGPEGNVVLEVFGEGKTDLGTGAGREPPSNGVVPILVYALCERPAPMRVVRKAHQFLQGKGLWQKVRFAKRQALYNGTAGVVFVMDSEGGFNALAERRGELEKGRDHEFPEFPMAVGVAQPCIEAWLLADASAIRQAFGLAKDPEVPQEPEKCPAPCQDEEENPKRLLANAAGSRNKSLSADECDRIAKAISDVDLVCRRCPRDFAPFAEEVRARIRPLFKAG